MIRALIFDFDGLILDTEIPEFQSWSELYQEHGVNLEFEEWAKIIGTSGEEFDALEELEKKIGKTLDHRMEAAERRWQRSLELVYANPVQPGVKTYLEGARNKGLKIGLASSSPCNWVTEHLQRLQLLHFFDRIIASDDVMNVKPHPDLFQKVITELGVAPDEVIVFEDSPNGITAAKRAGLFCVAVPNELTRRLSLEQADLQMESFEQVPLDLLLSRVEIQSS